MFPKLLPLFPENITTFIDLFMGSGAVTFAMVTRCKYVISNDNDEEIFNLFMVLKDQKAELATVLQTMPAHEKLFDYWKTTSEKSSVMKATRFIMLSNFGYMGKPDTFRFSIPSSHKGQLLKFVESTYLVNTIQFMCDDCRNVLPKINVIKKDFGRPAKYRERAFVYADPPYLGAGNKYQESLTEEDTRDLFSVLIDSGLRFAVSEFDNEMVIDLAKEHSLHVTS